MAVDTQKLFYLLDPVFQIENLAGKPVVGGHIEVFVAGTDTKYITWQDWGGARNPFKIPLRSDGRAVILVEPQYTYDVYVYDSFNNMVCSRLNVSPAIGGDVSVSGLTQVYHDETISGNGTPYEPLGIVSGGKTYEGIEPIVVNNDVNKISANNVALGLQEPLFFVEDSETACVIGCSAQTEIPSALSGKWDDASDVVIANSAQWSENTEYEAGSYVDIDNNTISVTGLQPEGDYAYNSALSSKLDVTALPQDLVHSGDLTAYQPAGDYQTAGDYLSASDSANFLLTSDSGNFLLTSDSGNFYPMEGNPSGFLTAHQSLEDYATKEWVEDKGYITGIDIQESANWNEATTVVNNNSAIWNNTTNVVSSNSAQWGASNPQIPVTGINGIKISESGDKVVFEVSGEYATTAQLADKQDITGMTAYQEAGDYYSASNPSGFITGVPDTYLQNTDLSTEDGKITAISGIPLSAGGNVAVYTDAALPNSTQLDADIAAGKAICIVYDGRNYWFDRKSSDYYFYGADAYSTYLYYLSFRPENNSWTRGQKVLATQSWVTAGMTAYQPAGDYLTTADSANFYTTANESGFITGVPDTYLQNTDLSTTDGKVTAISGIPLSAGGDVPEGVMVESGLEYNAVNEISGYNGSAIAQYGAEKQWLVHDDTLVHAANSAQYALGVNVSAVQSLMGLDETVLFSGNLTGNGSTAQLSEPITNFEKIKVYGHTDDGINHPWFTEFYPTETTMEIGAASNNAGWGKWFNFTITTGGLYTNVTGRVLTFGTTTWGNLTNWGTTKVIGIGRKQ